MEQETLVAIIGIGSALLGTAVGGAISYFSNKAIKSLEWVQSVKKEEIREKKQLYSEFLREVTHLVTESFGKTISDPSELEIFNNLVVQIELNSSKEVLNAAVKLGDAVIYTHVTNQKDSDETTSVPEAREEFVAAVKAELKTIGNT